MKYFRELFAIAFISAIVGGIVSLPVALLLGRMPLLDSLKGAGVGALSDWRLILLHVLLPPSEQE